MPTSVSTRANSEATKNVYPTERIVTQEAANSQSQTLLTSLLQTTLELSPLFELFFGQMQHLLKLNSCHFVHHDKQISLKLGTPSVHSCDYSLSIQQQYLGNVSFSRKQRFSEDELTQLEALLTTLVYPLRNALHYRDAINQALSDPLTGLGNRGALENALEHQWQMAQRYEQDLSVLMIDIDLFKSINDRYGHDVGDYVIQQVAASINITTRQTDLAFRYGGEEFLVLLNKTTNLGATIIAERIRENIYALRLQSPAGDTLAVSVSIGGSHLTPGIDKQTLVKHADQALYQAKHKGRNQVIFYRDTENSQISGHLSM